MRLYDHKTRVRETADVILATIRSEPEYRRLSHCDQEAPLSEYFERRLAEELSSLPGKLAEAVEIVINRRMARMAV